MHDLIIVFLIFFIVTFFGVVIILATAHVKTFLSEGESIYGPREIFCVVRMMLAFSITRSFTLGKKNWNFLCDAANFVQPNIIEKDIGKRKTLILTDYLKIVKELCAKKHLDVSVEKVRT